jgi:tRNA-dihydrouridine synthase B
LEAIFTIGHPKQFPRFSLILRVQIGSINLNTPLLLAPMAGYTDTVFRQICKARGAAVVYTEFVSADALVRHSTKTRRYLQFYSSERPIGMQIFGSEPETMALAVAYVADQFQPDFIDLNFGCSVRKVIKKGAGAALLKNLPLLQKIASAAVSATHLPVTAKFRQGWSAGENIAVEVAQRLYEVGIVAVTVHPRTAVEGFKKPADWQVIAAVKQAIPIPVIGNGDIKQPADALAMLATTGCDGVMIGRGALSNPWLFQQITELSNQEIVQTQISQSAKIELCLEQLEKEAQYFGERYATRVMKKFFGWYLRGLPGAAKIREFLVRSDDYQQMHAFLASLLESNRQGEVLAR